nr:hypothetical protein [uncultured bacterium]
MGICKSHPFLLIDFFIIILQTARKIKKSQLLLKSCECF